MMRFETENNKQLLRFSLTLPVYIKTLIFSFSYAKNKLYKS